MTATATCAATASPSCPECRAPLSQHVSGKPCLPAVASTARNLYDLPPFGWAWAGDAKDTER